MFIVPKPTSPPSKPPTFTPTLLPSKRPTDSPSKYPVRECLIFENNRQQGTTVRKDWEPTLNTANVTQGSETTWQTCLKSCQADLRCDHVVFHKRLSRCYRLTLPKLEERTGESATEFIHAQCTNKPADAKKTLTPTITPTLVPTLTPSEGPTNTPTVTPTVLPSVPCGDCSKLRDATHVPTLDPTRSPTETPTHPPSFTPTKTPTLQPSQVPTVPTERPTLYPSRYPTFTPTAIPTRTPSMTPTLVPSDPWDFWWTEKDETQVTQGG